MSKTKSASRIAVTGPLVLLALLVAVPATAETSDDPASYPTWEEVEAARDSEAATEATYERLQSALQDAQSESASASVEAVQAGLASWEAEQALAEAADAEQQIGVRLREAEEELAVNSEGFGRTVSWLYRDGTGLARYTELASAENSEEFMSKLSVATQVGHTWSTMADQASVAANTAASLREQAQEALAAREQLAEEASDAAEQAQRMSDEADAAVAAADERTNTVYEQLASLRGTTVETERQYQLGLQAAEQARQREEERRREAEEESDGGGGSGEGGGGSGGGGGGGVSDPAAAQAYARNAVGAYGWDGGQFSCLVDLWNGESGWRVDATNPSSGAYGIPQAWPAEKMAAAGADWRTNAATQVDWGLAYISAAYGTPCGAYNTWLSRNPHWY